jgi:hypothetical protein
MITELVLRVEYNNEITEIPVRSDIPLRLDMSAVENQDIGEFFSVGSQTFDLPGNRELNRFFNHAYDPSVSNVPGFYQSIPCKLLLQGETLVDGQLQLLEVVTDEGGYVLYKVQVTDNVVNLKDVLAASLISEADFSAYTHTLTPAFITGSWLLNAPQYPYFGGPPISGSIFYPMADYGTDGKIPFPEQPKIYISPGTALDSGSISFPNTPMQLKQFLPAIRVPELLDVLFSQANFTYTSSFVNTYCNNMYVLPKGQDDLGPVIPAVEELLVETSTNLSISVENPGGIITVPVRFDDLISGSNFNTVNYSYTPESSGQVQFNIRLDLELSIPQEGGTIELFFGDARLRTEFQDYLQTSGSIIFSDTANLIGNTPYQVLARVSTDSFENVFEVIILSGSTFEIDEPIAAYNGSTVDMAQQWDPKLKSIDVLKGFLTQFNLVVYPEVGQNRVMRVETFDDWIRQGEIKDWTQKFDTAIRTSINHTVDEQPKELIFSQADDNDRISKEFIENVPNFQYGTVRTIAESNITQGEGKVISLFGPTVPAPMITGSKLLDQNNNPTDTFTNNLGGSRRILPHLYKLENNEQKTFKFKPRIGYKIGPISSGTFYIQEGNGAGTGGETWYSTFSNVPIRNASYSFQSTIAAVGGNWSFLSLLSNNMFVYPGAIDLNYDNDYFKYIPGSYFNLEYTGFFNYGTSAYEKFWQTYIESLYYEGAIKVVMDVEFTPQEYKDIKLNDRIFIKNQAYRINKINGFNVNEDDVVTVELIKLYPKYWGVEGFIPGTTTTSTTTTTTTQPTTTTTSTSTSTSTSTTTTSTTIPPGVIVNYFTFIGFDFNNQPCLNNTNTQIYTDEVIDIGVTVYTDTGLTTPLDGQNLYWGYGVEGNLSLYSLEIDSNGVILAAFDCGNTTTTSTTSTTTEPTTTSTTSTTSTTTGTPPTQFYVHATEGNGDSSSGTACARTTLNVPVYFTGSVGLFADYVANFNSLTQAEKRVYNDSALTDPFQGATFFYGADGDGIGGASYAFLIQSNGDVGAIFDCNATTTTTSTQAYQNVLLYERSGGGGWDSSADACNGVGGTSIIAIYAPIGEPIEPFTDLFTDTNLTIPFDGNSKWFQKQGTTEVIFVDSSGEITQLIDCATTTTTSTSTTTTSTTAAPLTEHYSATSRGTGFNDAGTACGIGNTGVSIYSNRINVAAIQTGDTMYADAAGTIPWDSIDPIGATQWWSVGDNIGTAPTYALQIAPGGAVVGKTACNIITTSTTTTSTTAAPTTTTSTSTSTSTTTLDPTACFEWEFTCQSPGGCFAQYDDCITGNAEEFNMNFNDSIIQCARPTPTLTGGSVTLLGTCIPTTTTTSTSTSTTTSTTSTTTLPAGCNEFDLLCPLGSPGGCFAQWTDCNGTPRTDTIPEDSNVPVCALDQPIVSGGTAEFVGPCTIPTTTSTTTTTTTIVWNSLVAAYDAVSQPSACTRYCTGQGPNSTVYWIGSGVAFGDADRLYGLPDGFSQVPSGFYGGPGAWVFASSEDGPPGSGVIQSGTCPACSTTTTSTTAAPTTTSTSTTVAPTTTSTSTSTTTTTAPPITTTTSTSTTAAPTTTTSTSTSTSTTAAPVFSVLVSDDDRSSPTAACNNLTPNTTVYYTGNLGNGTRIYTDPGLTTPFGGSGDFYKFNVGVNGHRAEVSGDGTLDAYFACSAPTTTTSTTATPCNGPILMTNVSFATFAQACSSGPATLQAQHRTDGTVGNPQIGDIIYTNISCTNAKAPGIYYLADGTAAVEIGSGGVIIDIEFC